MKPSRFKCCLTMETRRRLARVLVALVTAKWLLSWRYLCLGLVFSRGPAQNHILWVTVPFLAVCIDIPADAQLDNLLSAM